jgi:hypothetical protein
MRAARSPPQSEPANNHACARRHCWLGKCCRCQETREGNPTLQHVIHRLGDVGVARQAGALPLFELSRANLLADHAHMLIWIPPKYAASQVIGFIKGKSAIHLALRREKEELRRSASGQEGASCPRRAGHQRDPGVRQETGKEEDSRVPIAITYSKHGYLLRGIGSVNDSPSLTTCPLRKRQALDASI